MGADNSGGGCYLSSIDDGGLVVGGEKSLRASFWEDRIYLQGEGGKGWRGGGGGGGQGVHKKGGGRRESGDGHTDISLFLRGQVVTIFDGVALFNESMTISQKKKTTKKVRGGRKHDVYHENRIKSGIAKKKMKLLGTTKGAG